MLMTLWWSLFEEVVKVEVVELVGEMMRSRRRCYEMRC